MTSVHRRVHSGMSGRKTNKGTDSSADRFFRQTTVRVAISGIVGALYAAMVVLFWFGAYSIPQIRVADSLMPLALIFGYAGAVGLSIGCLVGNYYGFASGLTVSFDVVGGAVANFVAAVLGYKLYNVFVARGRKGFVWIQIAILVENIVVSLIVGTYMALLTSAGGDFLSFAGIWYLTLFVASLISMNGIGYLVYRMTRVGLL